VKFSFATIKVKDIEKSKKFYQEITGLTIEKSFSPRPGSKITFLKDNQGGIIELIEDERIKNHIDNIGSVVSIAFEVENLDDTLKMLKEKNIKILSGPIDVGNEVRFAFIHDPNGVEVQFIQGFNI
jgi:lactoylglutathione lyase